MKSKISFAHRAAVTGADYQPDRARPLMRAIKGELELLRGRAVSYEELGGYVGQAGSTVFDKFQKSHQPQVECLLGWLERLTEATRHRLLSSACRTFPSLESPRLNHDPLQASNLKALLRQRNGFSLIQGGSESSRTFLITALGHECGMLSAASRGVCGIDVHEPDWFVPVGGVVYLNNLMDPTSVRECVHRHWPPIASAKRRLIVLNGIWAATQGLHGEIVELAAESHVLVADDFPTRQDDLARRAPRPSHVLTVTEERDARIRVAIQCL